MPLACSAVVLLGLLSICTGAHWDYSAHGPDVWSEDFPRCNGQRQSPINIKTECTDFTPFGRFNFTNEHSEVKNFVIENNGHTITVQRSDVGLTMNGANLDGIFFFDSFHLHWGPNHNAGSEHQM